MSGYYNDYDAPPQRQRSHKTRRPVYEEEEIYERGPNAGRGHREVVRRQDSSDSTEEIRRDFPPPGRDATYVKRKTIKREKAPRARSADRHDDYRSSRRDRRRRHDDYSDSYDSESVSPPPRRRQSLGEQALAALGIGGVAAAASGGRDRRGGRDRDRHGGKARSYSRGRGRRDDSSSRSRSRSVDARKKWQQAAKAAGTAAVLEAWKSRKEPGGITGSGKRIMTAAIGAAGVDSALDRNPDKHSKRHVIESAIGGLASNRLINGRSRSRSRSHGREKSGPGLGGLASAAGLAAVAAKGLNNYRSKSRDREKGRDRGRGRRDSYSSYSSSASPPPKRRSRSKSVSRFINAGMAKLGLNEGDKGKSSRRHYSDDDEYYNPRPRGGELSTRDKEKIAHGSDTDSYSSEEEQRKQKKMRGKEFLTAGLASVATIHESRPSAGHSVYQSIEKRKERQKLVKEGEMSPEESKRLRNRARLQDAAAVGIAALGIKGAVSEWKEMREQAHEYHEMQHRFEEKRAHRRAKMLEAQKNNSEPDLRGRYSDDDSYAPSGMPRPPMGSGR